jgi:hypothetical protein
LVTQGLGKQALGHYALLPQRRRARSGNNIQLGIGFVGVSLAFGLTVLTDAYAFGRVSGGHFNPAVTIALAVAKRSQWKGVMPYIVTQLVAATLAALVLLTSRVASRDSPPSERLLRRTATVTARPAATGWRGPAQRDPADGGPRVRDLGRHRRPSAQGIAPIAIGLGRVRVAGVRDRAPVSDSRDQEVTLS